MEDLDLKNIIEDIEYLASEKNSRMILNILVGNYPADVAQILGNLSEENEKYVFGLLDADTASDVIVELDDVSREKLVSELQHERISEIVDEMESDDATDLVAELPDEIAEKVLDAIDEEGSEEVKELLQHEQDTAGGIMALEYVSMSEETTVAETIEEIRAKAEDVPEVYNVYVVDKEGMLVGFLPLKNLIV
ncbi:MAG: magnesium transporter, partial [Caldithrix sp.]